MKTLETGDAATVRPLPSGLIAPGEAWAVTALLFAAGFALLAWACAPLGGVVLAALIVL